MCPAIPFWPEEFLLKYQLLSFQDVFILFSLHLTKYPQRNVNISHYDYIIFLFLYVSSDFCFIYLCFSIVRCLMVYNVYLLCELYVLSLKIFTFVSFKKFLKSSKGKKKQNKTKQNKKSIPIRLQIEMQ